MKIITCFVGLLLSATAVLFAQTAQLTGRVTDQSGSVVINAKVSAVNIDTGVVRGTISNETGNFLVTGLLPGSYRFTVEMVGFKQQVRGPLPLAVDQIARLDFALEVGETRETVLVEASAAILDTASSAIGAVVENRQIAELPLNGRDPVDLLGLTAGIRVQQGFGGVLNAGGGTTQSGAWPGFSFNGGIAGANPMLVEGLRRLARPPLRILSTSASNLVPRISRRGSERNCSRSDRDSSNSRTPRREICWYRI